MSYPQVYASSCSSCGCVFDNSTNSPNCPNPRCRQQLALVPVPVKSSLNVLLAAAAVAAAPVPAVDHSVPPPPQPWSLQVNDCNTALPFIALPDGRKIFYTRAPGLPSLTTLCGMCRRNEVPMTTGWTICGTCENTLNSQGYFLPTQPSMSLAAYVSPPAAVHMPPTFQPASYDVRLFSRVSFVDIDRPPGINAPHARLKLIKSVEGLDTGKPFIKLSNGKNLFFITEASPSSCTILCEICQICNIAMTPGWMICVACDYRLKSDGYLLPALV